MKVNFNPVSFGKFMDTRVFIDDKQVDDKEASDVTNLLCRILRKDKTGTKKTTQEERLRQVFEANVPDYKRIQRPDVFFSKERTPGANVKGANIQDLGSGRFLVTGKDIEEMEKVGNNFGYNSWFNKKHILTDNPEENSFYPDHPDIARKHYAKAMSGAEDRRQADLSGLALRHNLGKILEIRVKTMPSPKQGKEKLEAPVQMSLFDPPPAPMSKEEAEKLPLHKRYTIQSLDFVA